MVEVRGGRQFGRPKGGDGALTRSRLLHSAREVFSATGYDRATMGEIARVAGVTRSAISNYYPTKLDLHRAAFLSIEEDVADNILGVLPGVEAGAAARISAFFRHAIETNGEDLTLVRFWVTSTLDAVHHAELRAQSDRLFATVREYFEDVLVQGALRGEIDDAVEPVAAARLLMDVLWGVAMDGGFRSSVDQIRNTVAAFNALLVPALTAPTTEYGRVDT